MAGMQTEQQFYEDPTTFFKSGAEDDGFRFHGLGFEFLRADSGFEV